jgi:hypothetical protein
MGPYKYKEEIIIKILPSANLGTHMFAGEAVFTLTVEKTHKA